MFLIYVKYAYLNYKVVCKVIKVANRCYCFVYCIHLLMLVTKKLSFKKSSTQSQSFEKEKIMWWGQLQHHCILLSGIFWREIVQYLLTLEKVYECKFQHYHWSPQINGSIVLILAYLSLSKDQWDKKYSFLFVFLIFSMYY